MYIGDPEARGPLRKGVRLDHLSEELMSVNLVLRLVPSPFAIAMIASEMPAAMRPYSIAVAPDSSDKNLKIVGFNSTSAGL